MNLSRTKIQIAALIIANPLIFASILKFMPCPIMNCYSCPWALSACPIGTIQCLLSIGIVPVYTVGILSLIGSFFGRMTCGWVCPFGLLQDVVHRVPVKKINLSEKYTGLRYMFLGLVFLYPISMYLLTHANEKFSLFCKLCPVGVLEAGIPYAYANTSFLSQFSWLFYSKIVILVILVGLMTMIKRPFCRFVCPLGALFSPFNSVSKLGLRVGNDCIKCGKCQKSCPMNIKIYEDPSSGKCIRCLECTKVCEKIKLAGR